ncbi:DEAD/DEAH box helicase family protein [Lysinibacillus sp. NPDC094177]|uniref:DEAD/DEAH box helicase family protein n=1 Tax=Lysinibacillus sp. NPDC094177 TaxID=3390580 RepID=UPI003D0382F0
MKKYLSEILKDMELENNTLIVSPTGSGKTHYIFNDLIKEGEYLYLCDNENLKASIETKNRTFSNRKELIGCDSFSIEVMCYKEFGRKVRYNNNIVHNYNTIFCDEIHNLIDYQSFGDDADLSHVIKELFKEYSNTKIIYFTATPYYLKVLEQKHTELSQTFSIYDYSTSKEIMRYVNKGEAYINHLSQFQFQLDEYKQAFKYSNLKCLIFTREISVMKNLEKMCVKKNLKPICIWSRKNEHYEMTKEQLDVRDHLIKTGELLAPYNVLIMNRALETGINIYDKDMKLAIINTTNLTQQIQVRGRIRHDIDLLIVRTKDQKLPEIKLNLDEKYLNKLLSKDEVEAIIVELNIKDTRNHFITVKKFKDLLNNQQYQMKTKRKEVNNKRRTYYLIS